MPGLSDSKNLYDFVVSEFARIESACESKGRIGGMPTCFYELDEKIDGIHPGDIVLVAGRPLMGKSDFIINLALRLARKEKPRTISIFSMKLQEKICRHLLAVASRIPMHRLLRGTLLMSDWDKLVRAVGPLADQPVIVNADLCYSDEKILELVETLNKGQDLALVVIDGFEHLVSSKSYSSRKAEVRELIRSLRTIARSHQVPVIVTLTVLGKDDAGLDKHLAISDLDASELQVADASDVVLFLHRSEVYSPDSPEKGAEIMVVKNNYGNTGTVKLAYFEELRCFESLATGYKEDIFLEDF